MNSSLLFSRAKEEVLPHLFRMPAARSRSPSRTNLPSRFDHANPKCIKIYVLFAVNIILVIPVMAAVAVRKKSLALVSFHQAFIFSHCKSFFRLDQIKSNCMYWFHWKSEKKRTEPNELDELKCSKSLNQTIGYAHWHAFLYLHAPIKTFIYKKKKDS